MKVIFLDVDGELTYANYSNPATANIDIEKVKLLKEICDKTDAKVVISSSWRGTKNHTPHIYYMLIDILKDNGIEVMGNVPYINAKFQKNSSSKTVTTLEDIMNFKAEHGTGRAAEIQLYISEHDIDNFVILDDEDWDWADYGYDKYWIQPTWFGDGGLNRKHVEKAIEILNNK